MRGCEMPVAAFRRDNLLLPERRGVMAEVLRNGVQDERTGSGDGEQAERGRQPREGNGRYASRWTTQDEANPFGRYVARMRVAVAEALTEEDAVAIAKKL